MALVSIVSCGSAGALTALSATVSIASRVRGDGLLLQENPNSAIINTMEKGYTYEKIFNIPGFYLMFKYRSSLFDIQQSPEYFGHSINFFLIFSINILA
jgi:hypothetical protein